MQLTHMDIGLLRILNVMEKPRSYGVGVFMDSGSLSSIFFHSVIARVSGPLYSPGGSTIVGGYLRYLIAVPGCRLNTYGRPRAFPVAGPMVWNSLPDELSITELRYSG